MTEETCLGAITNYRSTRVHTGSTFTPREARVGTPRRQSRARLSCGGSAGWRRYARRVLKGGGVGSDRFGERRAHLLLRPPQGRAQGDQGRSARCGRRCARHPDDEGGHCGRAGGVPEGGDAGAARRARRRTARAQKPPEDHRHAAGGAATLLGAAPAASELAASSGAATASGCAAASAVTATGPVYRSCLRE